MQQTSAINAESTEIAQSWLPSVAYTGDLATHVADCRISPLVHVLTSDAAEMDAREKRMQEIRTRIDSTAAKYEPLITSDEERRLYERFRRGWANYLSREAKALELSRALKSEGPASC